MNRRAFLSVMTIASAAGVSAVPEVRAVGADHTWQIEPRPSRFDFEETQSVPMDCCTSSVAMALGRLEWDSADLVKPLLVVHPSAYPWAIEIAIELNQRIAIWATPFSQDRDTWFVVWRGRRVGSEGA